MAAVADFHAATALRPSWARAWLQLGPALTQGGQQQAAIAGETVATLKASHEVVTNLNAITADGKEAADYEKKQITTPLTKMQRLGRSLEDFGAMVLGHLL